MRNCKYQCHAAECHKYHQLTSSSCCTGAIQKKAYLSRKTLKIFPEKKVQERSNRSRKKNKGGDRKVESNDSPETPDERETSNIPNLTSGPFMKRTTLSTY